MSILTKTQVKNIFVTNAVPQQVDYSNWIDSCVFLNADGTVSLNSLVMPYEASPPLPDAGFAALFFNASDSNYLSVQNSAGNISRVTPNQYINLPIYSTDFIDQQYLFITKRPIEIVSARLSTFGIGAFSLTVRETVANGTQNLNLITSAVFVNVSGGVDPVENNLTIVKPLIPAGKVISVGMSGNSGVYYSVLTIEYKEP